MWGGSCGILQSSLKGPYNNFYHLPILDDGRTTRGQAAFIYNVEIITLSCGFHHEYKASED
jgi:hypothetical protein